jgi:hypothetical protein
MLIGLTGLSGGCGGGPTECGSNFEPAIEVTITDIRDGTPLAGTARGSVRDGEYLDSLRSDFAQPSIRRFAADDRPGIYLVEVLHPGRLPWSRAEVRVRLDPDNCHVSTVRLDARLEPIP